MYRTGCRCNLYRLAHCKERRAGKDGWDIGEACLENCDICYNITNLETEYTREAFASFPQVSEEDTPGTSRTVYPQFF